MESRINYTLVGLFVIVLSIALVILIAWLSVDFSMKRYKTYLVIMNEFATGITTKSAVQYNGISVGSVKRIQLSQQHPEQVRLLLRIEEHTPITAGTTATLNSQGMTGITYIALQGSDTDLRPLTILPGEQYPIIRSTPSLLMRLDTMVNVLMDSVNQITKDVGDITKDVDSILGAENPQLLREILRNLSVTSQHFTKQSERLDGILTDTAKTMRPLSGLMINLAQKTLPATNHVLEKLSTVSDNLLEFSDDLKQNPTILVRGHALPLMGPGEK